MGGQAFHDFEEHSFPRLPPSLYRTLKDRLTPILQTLYKYVETPAEVPEKLDHGDIDFVVCEPLYENVDKGVIQRALSAQFVTGDGHTTNFALPIPEALDGSFAKKYYQVDVHVCADKDDWERVVFFHSYGDLGMILGVLAQAHGFALGVKGLKIRPTVTDDTRTSSFLLSDSFPDILTFFRLSLDEWKRGFTTIEQVLKWIQTSRFFFPERMVDARKGRNRRKQRQMYDAFLEFSHNLAELEPEDARSKLKPEDVIQEALDYFGKRKEYEAIGIERARRAALKSKFSGSLVMAWTGAEGKMVKLVMDGVRLKADTDAIVMMETEELKELAIDVYNNLNHSSN